MRPPGALWALLPLGVLGWGLRAPLAAVGQGFWGPEDPWANGDLVGAWWLWWAFWRERQGLPAFALLEHPEGWQGVRGVFPNPVDLWLYSLSGPPTALAWNLAQWLHLALLVLAAWGLARRAGASPGAAAAGVSLVAASPVLLHEVAGGRPATLIAWPGVLALAALLTPGRWAAAGACAALQGVAYAWQGAALALGGLPLLRSRRQALGAALVGALLVAPYVLWVAQGELPVDRPPAGYTALPLAGLLGLDVVPPRFRLHPLLLLGALLGARHHPRLALSALLLLLLALGPGWTWALGEAQVSGPWAWVAWLVPAARRLHHPVRATLLLLPVLGALLALAVDRARGRWAWGAALLLAALANQQPMREVTAWARPERPPFADRVIPGQGAVVDLLGMPHRGALALQVLHGRPVLETAWNRRPDRGVHAEVERLSRGEAPDPRLWSELRAMGYDTVLVWDRFGDPRAEAARARVEEALGEEVGEGVWSLRAGE